MDYAWALGLALMALAFAVHGRATVAGALLGLVVGCRLPTAVLVIPQALLLTRGHIRFLLATALFGAIALAPSFVTYGTRFLSVYEFGRVPWIYVVKGATRDVWGVIGTVAVGIAVVISLFRLRAVPRRELWAVLTAVVLTGAVYLRLPHEGAYLLPIVPFVLLLMARTLGKPGAIVLASLLLVSSLFVNISQTDTHALRARGDARVPFRPSFHGAELEWGKGPLLVERDRRLGLIQTRDLVLERAKSGPPNAVVMVYELLPAILWADESSGQPRFVHLLPADSLSQVRQEGKPIFATDDAWDNEWQVYRVRPEQYGVQLLSMEPNSL
jgi:hypothetical protein